MVDAFYPGPISCGKSLALPTNGPVRSACYLDPDGPNRAPLRGSKNQQAPPGCAGPSNEIESEHAKMI